MKTIELTVYTAAELKASHPKGFKRAHGRYLEYGIGAEWSESTIEDFLAIASLMGFTVDRKDIHWSGFSSQGDGASFTGTVDFKQDALETVKAHAPQDKILPHIAGECARYGKEGIKARLERTSHHYSHDGTVSVHAYIVDADGNETELDRGDIGWTCRYFMTWLYRQLEKEYEHQTSEECFLETSEANEWHYTAEGRIQ